MLRCLVDKVLVKEVCVFETGRSLPREEWVIRCFGIGQLGDGISDTRPTEQELKEFFKNNDLLIRYEYDIISTAFLEMIKPQLADYKTQLGYYYTGSIKFCQVRQNA